jgi:hypothetical protein
MLLTVFSDGVEFSLMSPSLPTERGTLSVGFRRPGRRPEYLDDRLEWTIDGERISMDVNHQALEETTSSDAMLPDLSFLRRIEDARTVVGHLGSWEFEVDVDAVRAFAKRLARSV